MITTRDDYKRFLISDQKHLLGHSPSIFIRLKDPIWRFQRLLRKCEYIKNTSQLPSVYMNPVYLICKFRLNRIGIKLGFSISENSFDEGLSIAHYGSIIVNPNAHIGKNCRIHSGVNIGVGAKGGGSPVIGDNCYIGPGAKIFGDIKIGDNVYIGANSVVNKSFEDGHYSIGGIPAKILKPLNKDV